MSNNEDNGLNFEFYQLTKLHEDLEKQFLKLNEIIPYENQTTAKIFSPRILNIMLVCCPQIEAFTKLIAKRCNIDLTEKSKNGKKRDKGIPKLIREINSKKILSQLEIVTKENNLMFTPFTKGLEWWTKYTDLKHSLGTKQNDIDYTTLINALAALAALHYLASETLRTSKDKLHYVLDYKFWTINLLHGTLSVDDFGRVKTIEKFPFETLVFVIKQYYHGL